MAGRRGHGRRHALHVAQDALDHLLQVGLAFAQVLILHFVKLARDHLQLGSQRPFGVVQAVGHPVLDAADEHFVLQQHQVHVQQRGQLVRRLLGAHGGDALLQAVDLVHHRIAPGPHAADLCLDLVSLDEIVRDIHPAGRHQHGTPDGDAAGDCQAVDAEGHGFAVGPPTRRSPSPPGPPPPGQGAHAVATVGVNITRLPRICLQLEPAERPLPPAHDPHWFLC